MGVHEVPKSRSPEVPKSRSPEVTYLLSFELRAPRVGHAEVTLDEACDRDEGFVAVLLEELPLLHLRAGEGVGRHERGAFGEEGHDGVRLG